MGCNREYKITHMCVDIAGLLKHSTDNQLGRLFHEVDGSQRSGKYVRDWLRLQLAQGKKVLPMSKDCVGFSYETGCPGHTREPSPQEQEQAAFEDATDALLELAR